jgi:MoaA/NifB/PqqE/SkfB family radical SAM enzyme
MLRVVIIKPSKYGVSGYVERFRRGFMPNSTVPYIRSMTPASLDGVRIETHAIDEYVQTDLDYLNLIKDPDQPTLLAVVGVQSHQFQRALDLSAFAREHGVEHCVIGGPHPMTCDTTMLQGRGVSFALAEAELIWMDILRDAMRGELAPVYGNEQRWQNTLDSPVLQPPSRENLKRYVVPMLGVYPSRGCPFTCNFCSVIKIAGQRIRSQEIETTLASLRAAKAAGVELIMFTSDNFNKYPEATELLVRMIDERINLPFFVQCDTQIVKQEEFVDLLGRAGCFQMFVGVESFDRKTLLAVHKNQNHPEMYGRIVRMCREAGISTHYSNIIGFPTDTRESIQEHVSRLRDIQADFASFYILTPIPGTEQYDQFLSAGWITEMNLDRYDGQCVTWRHPHLEDHEIEELLFNAYLSYYTPRQIMRDMRGSLRSHRPWPFCIGFGLSLSSWLCAKRRLHPMSGGVGKLKVDRAEDYIRLRQKHFGFDYVPLPLSLQLPLNAKLSSG